MDAEDYFQSTPALSQEKSNLNCQTPCIENNNSNLLNNLSDSDEFQCDFSDLISISKDLQFIDLSVYDTTQSN